MAQTYIPPPQGWVAMLKSNEATRKYRRTVEDMQKQSLRIEQEAMSGSETDGTARSDATSSVSSGSGVDKPQLGDRDETRAKKGDANDSEDEPPDCLAEEWEHNLKVPWNDARYELRAEEEDSKSLSPSTSSSVRRKRQQRASLLEAIFSPGPAKRTMAVRPHVQRRHSTTATPKEASVVGSEHTRASTSGSKKSPSKPKRQTSGGLLASLMGPPSSPKRDPHRLVRCITCFSDDIPALKTAKLECGHRMCHACLKRLFVLSTTDPALMPPRCCTDACIPLRHVDRILSTKFKKRWNAKFAEYNTQDRLYCAAKGCGEWIPPKHIQLDRAAGRRCGTCPRCRARACKSCGRRWHGTRDCADDADTERVLELGREHGWQRCFACRALVQLAEGCNHMRCRCGSEFCMVCGSRWKTCECPWFNVPAERDGGFRLDPDILDVRRYRVRDDEDEEGGRGDGRFFADPPRRPPPPRRDRSLHPARPLDIQRLADMVGMPPPPPPPPPPPMGPILPPIPRDRPRPRPERRMMAQAGADSEDRRAQEAADEAYARRLQEEEFGTGAALADLSLLDGSTLPPPMRRHRAARRERRRAAAAAAAEAEAEVLDPLDADEGWMERLRPVEVGEGAVERPVRPRSRSWSRNRGSMRHRRSESSLSERLID